MMWFKKVEVVKEPYEYNKNVPFEIAFKALKERIDNAIFVKKGGD